MIATMFSFGAMSVSAAPSTVTVTVNYLTTGEVATLGSESTDAAPVYYALKYDKEKHSKAKWMPIQGTTLDISKYIPKATATSNYIIGFILKSELEAGTFDVKELEVVPRAADIAKTAVTWTPGTGMLAGTTTAMQYRMEGGGWIDATASLEISAARIPTATTIYLRTKATATIPASREIKVKIAAQPKAPGVPTPAVPNFEAKVSGLKAGMEAVKIATATTAPVWTTGQFTLDANLLKYSEILAKIGINKDTGATAQVAQFVAVRTPATDRKPASAVGVLEIPEALVKAYVKSLQ